MAKKPQKYRGVSYHRGRGHGGKYLVRVKSGATIVTLGMFDEAEFAARIYDYAARLVHGPAAMANFRPAAPLDETYEWIVRRRLQRAGLIAADE